MLKRLSTLCEDAKNRKSIWFLYVSFPLIVLAFGMFPYLFLILLMALPIIPIVALACYIKKNHCNLTLLAYQFMTYPIMLAYSVIVFVRLDQTMEMFSTHIVSWFSYLIN